MRIFPTIIRRTTVVISTVTNWLASAKAATKVSTVGTFLLGRPKPAAKVTPLASGISKAAEKPAAKVTTNAVGTVAQQIVKAAAKLSTVNAGTIKASAKSAALVAFGPMTMRVPEKAASVLLTKLDLSHTSFVVTAAQDAGGTGTWQNPTNMQGATNATVSTFSGGLVLGTGKLRGTAMVAQPNRPAILVIDQVYLRYHYKTTGLPVVSDLISQLALGFRINTTPLAGPDKDIAVVTSNDDFLVAGREIRIDDGAGKFIDGATAAVSTAVTWANIALIQPYLNAATIANGLMAYSVDSVRLRVVAHVALG